MEKFDGETNTLWQHLEADGKLKANGDRGKRNSYISTQFCTHAVIS